MVPDWHDAGASYESSQDLDASSGGTEQSERWGERIEGANWWLLGMLHLVRGTADDVGKTVVFLCSSAADYISGSALNVDGGYSVSVRLGLGTC